MNAFILRSRHRADTRETVLRAAAEEFRAHGYTGTSIRAIASRAGVATGTVLTVAPSKLELLRRVLAARIDAAVERALRVPREGKALDQLVEVAGVFFDTYAKEHDLYVELLAQSLWSTGEAGRAFEAQVKLVAEDIRLRLQRAHPEADIEGLVLAFLGAYYFALIIGLRDPAPDPTHMRALVRRSLSTALHSPEGTPSPTDHMTKT